MAITASYIPLSREEMRRVIEGRGCASRIPVLLHPWTRAGAFADPAVKQAVQGLLDSYPCDAQIIYWRNVDIYIAPEDDPHHRWMHIDAPAAGENAALDTQSPITDWAMLDDILADFPSADYPNLFPDPPAPDGRYRIAHWWYTLFERHWSLRGMTNALMDYYTNPAEVHRLFRAFTDFYLRMIERAKEELDADAVYSTDDLGTQIGLFFSPGIFEEFFAPYYRELFEKAHSLGMHYWLHTCGNVELLLPKFIELGLDVIHPIQKYAMDECAIAERFGGQVAFWAGFDVQQVIPFGTPDDVRREVRHLFDTYYRPDGRLLFTAGNGITGDTPLASLDALFSEAFAYGNEIAQPAKVAMSERVRTSGGLTAHMYAAETQADALQLINTYIAGWPYSHPVDEELLDHWPMLGDAYQSEHMLIAYRDGVPRAFLHGERQGMQHNIHLLAMAPGAVEEGVWLLTRAEEQARADGITRLVSPHWRTGIFYGGYVCGLEPYHPHWAVDGTAAYLRAGFRISHPGVILVRDLQAPIAPLLLPDQYQLKEAAIMPEFNANAFRLIAICEGKEVATCAARLYPHLTALRGGLVGQVGYVGTEEAHRGKGLARALVQHCLARLREWGAGEVLIATGLDNIPALKAYEAVGFQRKYFISEWEKSLA